MTKCNNLGLKNYDYGDKSDLYHFISFLKSGIYLAFLGLFVNVTRFRTASPSRLYIIAARPNI